MAQMDRIRIIPVGICFRVQVQSQGMTYSKSYSTLSSAVNDAASRGLIQPRTANDLVMHGLRKAYGWSDNAVRVNRSELLAHSFACS